MKELPETQTEIILNSIADGVFTVDSEWRIDTSGTNRKGRGYRKRLRNRYKLNFARAEAGIEPGIRETSMQTPTGEPGLPLGERSWPGPE